MKFEELILFWPLLYNNSEASNSLHFMYMLMLCTYVWVKCFLAFCIYSAGHEHSILCYNTVWLHYFVSTLIWLLFLFVLNYLTVNISLLRSPSSYTMKTVLGKLMKFLAFCAIYLESTVNSNLCRVYNLKWTVPFV